MKQMKTIITISIISLLFSSATINAYCIEVETLKKLEINCTSPRNLNDKWGAVCSNGTSTTDVTGVAKCSFIASEDGTYGKSENIQNNPDEDNIHCWCQISTPFTSPYIYTNEYLYQTECENWCATFCAQNAISNQKFRDAIFSNLKPNQE